MLSSLVARLCRPETLLSRQATCCLQRHNYAAQPQPAEQVDDDAEIEVTVNSFRGHHLDELPSTKVQTSKGELMRMFTDMYVMRRMELAADMLYKQKLARGFLHLADGQEAVPVGIEAACTYKDSLIQSYRDHCTAVARGVQVKEVFAELLGKVDGCARGLGGSMHMYKAENNFYGGMGIVGTHIPLGAGLGLAHKIRNDGHVNLTLYGDGAANQGQVAEAYNIAAIWRLPVIFVIENNHFGMGTSENRASKSAQFYTRGDYIPGLWIDGMDVLAVKRGVEFARKHALEKGPIVLEMDTYRYHGHSISDPGSSYRTRDEIQGVRRARDPIEHVRALLTELKLAEGSQLKQLERKLKKGVQDDVEFAKKSSEPPMQDLWNNIYMDGLGAKFRNIDSTRDKIQLPNGVGVKH